MTKVKELLKDSFRVSYRPQETEQTAKLLNYNIKDFKDWQEVIIQLRFDEPLLVSNDMFLGK